MSTANELMRRALEELEIHGEVSTWDLIKDIRTFLAAEPEAEYDFYGVIPLTHRKAKGIIKDKGYHVTGFVLSRPDGDKCIVDMSAVRWLSGKEFFEMMHPVVTSPTAEPEAEPVAWRIIPPPKLKITDGSWLFYDDQDVVKNLHNIGWKVEPLYTRPEPARKPMTEEEIPYHGSHYYRAFLAGVRFAEKHHGIGEEDVRETPGD